MISTPRGRDDQSQRTTSAVPLLARTARHSLAIRRSARAWARAFRDPDDVTWWVHLVRADAPQDSAHPGRLPAMTLRFQNGIGADARYLHPIPPDWRECDDVALWAYFEQAAR